MSKEKLAQYSQNFETFVELASQFDAKSVLHSNNQSDWSAAFIFHHIADSEMHFALRYFNALTIDKPAIIPFDEEAYPSTLNYEGRDWLNSLTLIKSIGTLVRVTLSAITETQWERTSLHPELGEVSMSTLIGKASTHMAAHTEQLRSIGVHV